MSKGEQLFRFKEFSVRHGGPSFPIGTDGLLLGAWAQVGEAQHVLEVGTGCGFIALMLAQRSQAHIDAVEIDAAAARQAQENVQQSPWAERVAVFQGPIQEFQPPNGRQYDHIISNPPFFHASLKSPSQVRTRSRHTDTLPLPDLLEHSLRLMSDVGRLSLMLPVPQGEELIALAQDQQLHLRRILRVRNSPQQPVRRLLLELGLQPQPLEENELAIRVAKGSREHTEEYRALTQAFHTIF